MSERQRIVVACGLPGCGKTRYFAEIGANAISSDDIRRQLADDERDQTINARVFAVARFLTRQRVEIGRPATYIDATNLTRRERKSYLAIARETGCAVEALWFDVPAEVCRARNAARGRVVPAFAMDLMAAKFVPPSEAEGFSAIFRVV